MKTTIDDTKPIYIQIAEILEDEILEGNLKDDDQVMSTNELAEIYRINPATARQGVNILVDEGIIYKKRGIGMFVTQGAKNLIINKRKKEFHNQYIPELFDEASKLNISKEELMEMIKNYKGGQDQ
ncbi:GntR family transcriptional regulator [Natronospora cellulosivora (SeqCode)]